MTDRLNGVTRENLTGIRVVRAFNAEKYQEHKFDKTNTELADITRFVDRVMSVMSPMMYMVMNGITLVIYCIGAYLIGKEKIYESHLFEKADECRMHVEEVLKRALEA